MGVMDGSILLFWLVAGALALASGLLLLRGAARAGGVGTGDTGSGPPARAEDIAVYRDQLSEVARDVVRGTLAADEAERLRAEIARRILEADRASREDRTEAAPRRGTAAAVSVVGLAMLGALASYAWLGAPGYPDVPLAERIARAEAIRANRPSQAEAVAKLPAAVRKDPQDPEMADLMTRLREAVAKRPGDQRGLELLAQNEAALGNYAEAAAAWSQLIGIRGRAATAGDSASLADALILQANGYVSPEAEAALGEALSRDPGNGTARFYMGLLEAQIGRPDLAFRFWAPLLDASPPGAPWIPFVRERIDMVARAAGVRYTPPPPPADAPGPGAADIAAAAAMPPEDRQAMIGGMVERLSQRLASQGGSGAEWAQLITALGVLGDTARARAVWGEAQNVFAAAPDDLEQIAAAARKAGVAR